MVSRSTYHSRVKKGQCGMCGEPHDKGYKRKNCKSCLLVSSEYSRNRINRCRRDGKCYICGKDNDRQEKSLTCSECLEEKRPYNRARMRRIRGQQKKEREAK